MFVKKRSGKIESVHFDKITERISKLINTNERKYIDPVIIAQKTIASIYNGITTEELDLESAKICINLCTTHYLYSSIASRILISNLHKKTLNTFVEKENLINEKLDILDVEWLQWINENKDELNSFIDYSRDYIYDYFGFKTLERAYLMKIGNDIIERPQDLLMRVSSFINKGDLAATKNTYDMMSLGFYTHASPTLFNAGSKRSQLSSCYLLGTDDTLEGITKTWADVSKISKWGGGIGIHISNIRAKDSLIRGTNGPSSGIIPMLKVYNEIARYIDQCFIGTTKIYTKHGLLPIEKIKPGNKVFTIDGSLQCVKRVYCDLYKGKILNFAINNDYESIKVTPTHPFYVIKNQPSETNFNDIKNRLDKKYIVPEWIDAQNITKDDLIGIPIPKYIKDNAEIDESDCYMYGLMLKYGDICSLKNEFSIIFDNYKLNLIDFTIEYLKQSGINYTETKTETTYRIKWEPTSKFKFIKSQLYNEKNQKYIDSMMLNLPENKIKYIIKEFLETPETSSINIIDGIKYILLRMGILGYIKDNYYILNIPKSDDNSMLNYFNHNDILYTRIKDITEEEIETNVYDLEIENNHNYLTQAGLVHNGGKRKGSIAFYLEPHHADIKAFLELRKNSGAETERARDLFTALWISDLFMKQVENDGDWYLMCPDTCKGLCDVYGDEYEKLYYSYVNQGKYKEKVKARDIWQLMLESQLETGTPYITFKDSVNNKSNQKNVGIVRSSNLCVHENTQILTDNGYKNIKSLKDQETNVWNGEEWSKVTIKQTGTNQNLIRVNLSNGSFLDCTPEHIFYVQSGFSREGTNKQVSAKDLKNNDKLIKFKLPEPINLNNNEDFIFPYTHGAFCGDGTTYDNYSCTKKYPKLYLYGAKKNLLQYINYESCTNNESSDRYDIVLPKNLKPKFEVPINASINNKLKWFEGYCDTDGTIARNGTNEALQIASINKDFLLNVRLMLHTLGIESKVTKVYDERYTVLPDHKGGSKEYLCKPAYRILIGSNDLYNLSLLGFSPKRLNFTQRLPQRNATQFVKVLSIEESYKNVDTYCFTEPLKHKGVFNGILTGQCNEIVQYSDQHEYAVCNLASIAVNKFVEPFVFNQDDEWVIYSKENCKYCTYAKTFLTNKGIKYLEIKNKLPENKKTYPQIYHNDKYIGGYDDFFDYIKGTFNYEKLYETAYIATKNLNKIIDINYYPVIETKLSNMKHRPIGLGIQGLADTLVLLKTPYDSDESVELNKKIMETIYLASVTASIDTSKEIYNEYVKLSDYLQNHLIHIPEKYDENYKIPKNEINNLYHKLKSNKNELINVNNLIGAYSSFKGSPMSEGKFQFDLWNIDRNTLMYKEKWTKTSEEVVKFGIRNSLLTALMPTASTSQILGNNECFEFFTNNIYTRRTLAGDFPLVNKYLIDELYDLNLWSNEMKQMIIANNGSINNFNEIPAKIRRLYQTIWEIKQIWTLKNAVARGPFVDQTQSMNIFMAVPDFQKLHSSHFWSWKNGLKTGIYYLRSKPAKEATKVTVDNVILNKVKNLNEEHEVCENCSA